MSAVSKLIKVKYVDATSYTAGAGEDILGAVISHPWGPANELNTYTKEEFFNTYPESPEALPGEDTNASIGLSYLQIKRAFECGIKKVEVYRAESSNLRECVSFGFGGGAEFSNASRSPSEIESFRSEGICVAAKYTGCPTKSMIGDYDRVAFGVEITNPEGSSASILKIKVYGATYAGTTKPATGTSIQDYSEAYFLVDTDSPLESWEGSCDASAMQDGKSYYISNVCADSDFIEVIVGELNFSSASTIMNPWAENVMGDYSVGYPGMSMFADSLLSEATMLIAPDDETGTTAVSDLLAVAEERQDVTAVVGYPVGSVFSKEKIEEYLTSLSGVRNMFAVFVAGREVSTLCRVKTASNCIGAWCGHTAKVAAQVRTNQLASAFSYGAFNGTLTATLSFDDVHDLSEQGVISVFSSKQGPLIWGTHSLHPRQLSYFGKANVMRVLSKILRQVFPVCLDAIHTDAAANAITRAKYDTMFNRIIGDEVSQQNLQSDSYADCVNNDINSDLNTKGGTIFNLLMVLHFIGLVESFNIKVVATDSSVTASISMNS